MYYLMDMRGHDQKKMTCPMFMPSHHIPSGMNMPMENPMHSNMYMAQSPQQLLDLLFEAMKDELHDRAKYEMMMDMTSSDKCKKQIEFAYEDEGKHYKMFQHIYHHLTGKPIEVSVPKVERYDSIKEAIETSIDGELEAVEMYRKIYAMLPSRMLRDMLYEIITDEQEHATRFVYLCGCVKC
ncbi:ferritin-like domain-containing protein [Fonticella tunisiensis]|uniref:Rubrerythrin n=1 Tax=Fonticella tunisiensis TaxID=1096341 RepID=A0A4R7KBK5_9CLOT|nr:ferritin-like domain-containing protein [Fonticella tunisiensis]TDT52037.1 rubrerythrin [Fonticella tunisiensis]